MKVEVRGRFKWVNSVEFGGKKDKDKLIFNRGYYYWEFVRCVG